MARQKTNKRQKRALDELLEKGASITALGIVLLVVPLFLGASPMLKPLAGALRTVLDEVGDQSLISSSRC